MHFKSYQGTCCNTYYKPGNEIFKEIIEKHYDDEQLIKEINSLIYGARKNEEEFIIILNSKKYEKDLKIIFNFTEYFQKIKSEISELKIKCKDFFSKSNHNLFNDSDLKE